MRIIHTVLTSFVLVLLLASCTRDRPSPDAPIPDAIVLPDANATTAVEDNGSGAALPIPAVGQNSQNPSIEPTAISQDPNQQNAQQQPAVEQATPVVVVPTVASDAASSQPGTQTIQYTVKSGDTLFSIAENYGVTADVLRQLNYLPGDNLQANQVLRIPLLEGYTAAGKPTPTPPPLVHVVQSGETLYGISLQYGVDPTAIIAANNIADQNGIFVSQELLIPGYATSPTSGVVQVAPTQEVIIIDPSNSTGSPAAVGSGAPASGVQVVHVVQPGEGLYAIAVQYDVAASDIADANNIQNYELLRAGQQLFIPGVAANAPAVIANRQVHTVQAGEGLLQIAVNYGVSAASISAANNLADSDLIYPGQTLIIPEP